MFISSSVPLPFSLSITHYFTLSPSLSFSLSLSPSPSFSLSKPLFLSSSSCSNLDNFPPPFLYLHLSLAPSLFPFSLVHPTVFLFSRCHLLVFFAFIGLSLSPSPCLSLSLSLSLCLSEPSSYCQLFLSVSEMSLVVLQFCSAVSNRAVSTLKSLLLLSFSLSLSLSLSLACSLSQ